MSVLDTFIPIRLRSMQHLVDLIGQRSFTRGNGRDFTKALGARCVHLGLSTGPLLWVEVRLLLRLLMRVGHHRDLATTIIVLVLDTRVWEGRLPLLLRLLGHILAHANELFDQEFKHRILVLGFHLCELL